MLAGNTQQQTQQETNWLQPALETQPDTSSASKRPRTEHQQNAQCKEFAVLTHNLMGMTTVLEETALTADEHAPDVMVYTETKLTDESRNQLDKCLPKYKLYHSCKASLTNRTSKSGKERSRKAQQE